jgi:hypothetical protein
MGGKGSGDASRLPKGRPKGTKNKFSADIKAMVIKAVNNRGGVAFFEGLDDPTLARVATKLVPQIVDANVTGEMTQVVKIISSGEGKKSG